MALGQNPFNPSRTLPTLAAIQRRRRGLLAYQAASFWTKAQKPETSTNSPEIDPYGA